MNLNLRYYKTLIKKKSQSKNNENRQREQRNPMVISNYIFDEESN